MLHELAIINCFKVAELFVPNLFLYYYNLRHTKRLIWNAMNIDDDHRLFVVTVGRRNDGEVLNVGLHLSPKVLISRRVLKVVCLPEKKNSKLKKMTSHKWL